MNQVFTKNAFGIRIENLELVKKNKKSLKKENFLYFETLTMVPYEKKLISKKLLNNEEVLSINNYHKQIRKKLINFISHNEKGLINFLIKKQLFYKFFIIETNSISLIILIPFS